MSSLFQLLFDCLGFAGALDETSSGLPLDQGDELKTLTVGRLSDNVDFCDNPAIMEQPNPPIDDIEAANSNPGRVDVYGWHTALDPTNFVPSRFEHVTCRPREDNYRGYVVLDSVEFGSGVGDAPFVPTIHTSIRNTQIDLPLSNDARLASFKVRGINFGAHDLWPLASRNTWGAVHVFAYDVAFPVPTVTFTKELSATDSDYPELQKFLRACQRLDPTATPAPANDQSPASELLTDNLWLPAAAKVAGVLGELGNPGKLLTDIVTLQAMRTRIVVIINLTPCSENADYQPGQPGGVARLYPHVMVRSNFPLDYVDAAIRFTRPEKPTPMVGAHCPCDEMNNDMHALVVADANADNLQDTLPGESSFPPPVWNNIFNYYVTDADQHLPSTVDVVRRNAGPRTDWFASILRKKSGDSETRITRTSRQGAFDNIHMAPSMRLPPIVAIKTDDGMIDADANARSSWKLDEIVMAPFCVHDCFHMHWRWSDNSNEPGTFGYHAGKPNRAPGAPMVPENQDVQISVPAHNQFVYKARAWNVPADEWQVFCHHGAGYLVKVGLPMTAARHALSVPFARAMADGSNVTFLKSKPFLDVPLVPLDELRTDDSWAAFYWQIRYFDAGNGSAGPTDRVIISNLRKVIDF